MSLLHWNALVGLADGRSVFFSGAGWGFYSTVSTRQGAEAIVITPPRPGIFARCGVSLPAAMTAATESIKEAPIQGGPPVFGALDSLRIRETEPASRPMVPPPGRKTRAKTAL